MFKDLFKSVGQAIEDTVEFLDEKLEEIEQHKEDMAEWTAHMLFSEAFYYYSQLLILSTRYLASIQLLNNLGYTDEEIVAKLEAIEYIIDTDVEDM
ncbi:MAG: hypothetical protein ATN35_05610 [Epulopiscium sp. Nele67-Bin004]|nr:MAG: hypothetical protein ATN35_05610 [Epulopiscium sp. Nele67-Bin004]